MIRVAAVDCGTNMLRFLIMDVDPRTYEFVDLERQSVAARLGEDLSLTGRLTQPAMDRALDAIRGFGVRCREQQVGVISVVATSVLRDAGNRGEFAAGVKAAIGHEPEVLLGREAARLTFIGAVRGLQRFSGTIRPVGSHVLVVDVGGGSTKLIIGDAATCEITALVSLDLGYVSLAERHGLNEGRASQAQYATAQREIDMALDIAEHVVPLAEARRLVGVDSTLTTITGVSLRYRGLRPASTHGTQLSIPQIKSACADLMSMLAPERAQLPLTQTGQADVLGAGALIWATLLDRVMARSAVPWVVTSHSGLLDGAAWSLVDQDV